MEDKRGLTLDPISLMIAFIAIVGAIAFIINKSDFGLVLLIISTLIEAIARMVK